MVTALVVGDDAGLSPSVVADMQATGLTHLAAVSGTNLTLVLGSLLLLAAGVTLYRQGVWAMLLQADPTGLTLVIIVVFVAATLWCGMRARELQQEAEQMGLALRFGKRRSQQVVQHGGLIAAGRRQAGGGGQGGGGAQSRRCSRAGN